MPNAMVIPSAGAAEEMDRPVSQPADTFPDLVFVSLEDWDWIWRRNQFLCAAITRRFPATRILFVGLSKHVPRCLATGRASELWQGRTWQVPECPNVTVTHALRLAPERHALGRRLNEALTRGHVRGEMRRLGMERPLLWLNAHFAVHMAGQMGERSVAYDITDDWALATISGKERTLLVEQDRTLCSAADVVVVCSEALRESRSSMARRLLLLPNGVDAAHYAVKPPITSSSGGPVFGYTGTLHPDRIDIDLLINLSQAYPLGLITLIGPDHLTPEIRSRLLAQRNIRLTGPVAYSELPSHMASFDVCIVPHLETPFTESLNPIKLWEYLAFGRPIVSTNVAGFRDYPRLCRIASGSEAFTAACAAALLEGDRLTSARRDEAAQHSWDSRLDTLVETLRMWGAA